MKELDTCTEKVKACITNSLVPKDQKSVLEWAFTLALTLNGSNTIYSMVRFWAAVQDKEETHRNARMKLCMPSPGPP